MPTVCMPAAASFALTPPAPQPSALPALWNQLPPEIQEQVLASLQGKDLFKAVRVASQVHPEWHAHLRSAQPQCYANMQQRLWLMEAAGQLQAPTTARSKEALSHLTHVGFKGVSRRDGLEAHLRSLDAPKLQALAALMPKIKSCSFVGLDDGPALFAQWTQKCTLLHNIDSLVLDRNHVAPAQLRTVLTAAHATPQVARVVVGNGTCARPGLHAHHLESLNPKLPPLDFACWPLLHHLDLQDSRLQLCRVRLDRNGWLHSLNVSGNIGADQLLLGDGAPQASLRALTLSIELWNMHSIERLGSAPWAPTLQQLTFTPSSSDVVGLDVRPCVALQALVLDGQPVDYSTLALPEGQLQRLSLNTTTLCDTNLPKAYALALPQLQQLLLGNNTLHGVLNALHLPAARRLEHLDLSRCGLTDEDIARWDMFENTTLTHLELSGNRFSGAVWGLLAQKKFLSLRYLGLRLCHMRKDNILVHAMVAAGPLRDSFPKLEQLSVQQHGLRSWQEQEALDSLLLQGGVSIGRHEG